MAARSAGVAWARRAARGIAVHQFEDPAGGDIPGEQGQLGEGQGQQMMELVEETGALADDGLQSSGDLAEDAEL